MDFRHREDGETVGMRRGRNLGVEAGLGARPVVRITPADADFRSPEVRNDRAAPAPTSLEPSTGAQARYTARIGKFVEDGRPMPKLRHHALWLLHNCVAHPLLAVAGKRVSPLAVEFHELTSLWLNHAEAAGRPSRHSRVVSFRMPEVKKTGLWMLHNIVAHTAIGLAPCKPTFDMHDWSARAMDVPDWV